MHMADPLSFDPERVLANARQASDEDLLHRVTVYRRGMEPEALEIIERELRRRGFSAADIAEHGEQTAGEVVGWRAGAAMKCTFCHAPAISAGWGWHRLFGRLPVFPRYLFCCKNHQERL
jgi:hypothetical protein